MRKSLDSILIIDYGMGNVGSVANMLRRLGVKSELSKNPNDIRRAQKLILPGVGAFDAGISMLRQGELSTAIGEAVDNGAYILGICLGMQLLFEKSEEGHLHGLGLIPGEVKRFMVEDQNLKVPHMGWNIVYPKPDSVLFDDELNEQRFYFVHSFYAECKTLNHVSATAFYGHNFTCAVQNGKVFGVQFHPEKSHKFGMRLFRKFIGIQC